jgi:DNA polymerase (family 10)
VQNADVARKLEELAQLLESQDANPHRVRAWRRASALVLHLGDPVNELVWHHGLDGLMRLPGIGPVIGRAVCTLVHTGRLPMLDRLRAKSEPQYLLRSVPGIGRATAQRLVEDLGVRTLEALETAAHDGRLENLLGLPEKTIRGIADSLSVRLARVKDTVCNPEIPDPPVSELLDVDREYREAARAGILRLIAPRRFNPGRVAWLPVLHTSRGDRDYTALFSNTARAHALERTGDWVILHYTVGEGIGGRQATVVTETSGELAGARVVRGREEECRRLLAHKRAA